MPHADGIPTTAPDSAKRRPAAHLEGMCVPFRCVAQHLKKQPRMSSYFFGSIIATTDNDYWRKQRNHLNPVFLPGASLAKIFPTSLEVRADAGDVPHPKRSAGLNFLSFHAPLWICGGTVCRADHGS